jgi:hypothetical protein
MQWQWLQQLWLCYLQFLTVHRSQSLTQIHFVMCHVEPQALLELARSAPTIVTLEARKVKGAVRRLI